MNKDTKYPINELFHSIQGEGYWVGISSVFIRLQGCAVGCPWCDTKHTWELNKDKCIGIGSLLTKDKEDATWGELSFNDIFSWIKKNAPNTRHIVFTGGEPLIYDLESITFDFITRGFTVQIETSGTELVSNLSAKVWVTLSPKFNMPGGKIVLSEIFQRANEVKIPLSGSLKEEPKVIFILGLLEAVKSTVPVYLQPLSQGKVATALCVALALKHGLRVGVQLHKYIEVE